MGYRPARRLQWILLTAIVGVLSSCSRIDDDRIPAVPVNIVFTSQGMWETYGVSGAGGHRRFIRTNSLREPANFPYAVSSYTGYGGVLLISDYFGNYLAYDLSCPYEAKPDIRIKVDEDHHDAVCPVCGSTYDIFSAYGHPTSGPAATHGYGLTRYRVSRVDQGLTYMVITR